MKIGKIENKFLQIEFEEFLKRCVEAEEATTDNKSRELLERTNNWWVSCFEIGVRKCENGKVQK
jgi:hypothetical protein